MYKYKGAAIGFGDDRSIEGYEIKHSGKDIKWRKDGGTARLYIRYIREALWTVTEME